MDPELGKAAFRMAVFIFVTALGLLLIVQRGSAEYYVTLFTILIGAIFIAVVALLVRRSSR